MSQSLAGGQAAAVEGGAAGDELAGQVPPRLLVAVQQFEVVLPPHVQPAPHTVMCLDQLDALIKRFLLVPALQIISLLFFVITSNMLETFP